MRLAHLEQVLPALSVSAREEVREVSLYETEDKHVSNGRQRQHYDDDCWYQCQQIFAAAAQCAHFSWLQSVPLRSLCDQCKGVLHVAAQQLLQ
jgi:hypothetical protein